MAPSRSACQHNSESAWKRLQNCFLIFKLVKNMTWCTCFYFFLNFSLACKLLLLLLLTWTETILPKSAIWMRWTCQSTKHATSLRCTPSTSFDHHARWRITAHFYSSLTLRWQTQQSNGDHYPGSHFFKVYSQQNKWPSDNFPPSLFKVWGTNTRK